MLRASGVSKELLKRVAVVQLLLFGAVYLVSLIGFVTLADGVTERFTALARGPYLATAIGAQLRLIPAYGVMALAATVLSAPLLARWARRSFAGLFFQVLGVDLFLLVLSLGPALQAGPGLVDAVARKIPLVDLYALHRWHALEVLTVLFALTALFAVFSFGRRVGALAAASVLLLGAGTWYHPAPARTAAQARPNVLIIATDSWRFDRVGVHGSARAGLTPHIDAFSKQATDFTNLHVATASTLEAWVTLFSGQLPATHGIRSMYPTREEVRSVEANPGLFPRLLHDAGYETIVSSDWVGNCFDLVDLGFSKRRVAPVQNFEALLYEATVRAHPLVPLFFGTLPGPLGELLVPGRASLAVLARPGALVERLFEDVDESVAKGRPFFGLLFLSPTHIPYNARYPFNLKYAAPGYAGPNRYQVEVNAHELITTGFAPTLAPDAVQHIRDLYDGAVSDFDDTVGRVLAELGARGLSENTVVIITTDHGEDLYDPGSTLGHGTNFFGGDQSTHVPFFMRLPGQQAPSTVSTLARTVDLAPTLLEWLELPVPASMEGESLLPALRGEPEAGPGRVSYAESCYLFFPKSQAMTGLTTAERAQVVELAGAADTLEVDPLFRDNLVLKPALRDAVIAAKDRMIRTTRWKLIEIPGKTRPIHRLYDLSVDPHQQHDLAGQGLPVEAELTELLARSDCSARHL